MKIKTIKAQVWIETVLYTLIGLVLIALVLTFATPKINEARDNLLIEQSVGAMQLFGEKIDQTLEGSIGTRSVVTLTVRKGQLIIPFTESQGSTKINGVALNLINLNKLYSEPGQDVRMGRVYVNSLEGQKQHSATVKVRTGEYPVYFCKTSDESGCSQNSETFSAASTPYRLSIEKALDSSSGIKINIREVS